MRWGVARNGGVMKILLGFVIAWVVFATFTFDGSDTVTVYSLAVRRHIKWNSWRPDLREYLAHLVQDIKRRICGIASAGSPLFSV
jgi:hypothetical protein